MPWSGSRWSRGMVDATLGRYASHAPAVGPAVDRLERVAVPAGDARRTLVFVRGTVVAADGPLLTLAGASGRRWDLLLGADTALGTRRLPTRRADLAPGAVVAAVAEQRDGHDLALRIVAVPAAAGWLPPPTPA